MADLAFGFAAALDFALVAALLEWSVADFTSLVLVLTVEVEAVVDGGGRGPLSGIYVYSTPLADTYVLGNLGTSLLLSPAGLSTVIVISLLTGLFDAFSAVCFLASSRDIPSAKMASVGSCFLDSKTFSNTSVSTLVPGCSVLA